MKFNESVFFQHFKILNLIITKNYFLLYFCCFHKQINDPKYLKIRVP